MFIVTLTVIVGPKLLAPLRLQLVIEAVGAVIVFGLTDILVDPSFVQ